MQQQGVASVIRGQRRKRRVQAWAGFVIVAAAGIAWAGLSRAPLNDFDGAVFGGPIGIPEPGFIVEDFPAPVPQPIPLPVPAIEAPVPFPTPEPFDG